MIHLTILLACLAAPAADVSSPGIRALEDALRVAPSDALRLAAAQEWAALGDHCEQTMAAYREFFQACDKCTLREVAITELDHQVGRCFPSLAAENRFRAELGLAPGEPDLPASATCGEITRLSMALDDRSHLGKAAFGESAASAPLGSYPARFIDTSFCGDTRARLWNRLLGKPVSGAEVRRLLSFVNPVDRDWFAWALAETDAAEAFGAMAALEALREDVLVHFADPRAFESCLVAVPFSSGRRGWVTLNTLPESEVYLDGVSVGTTPVARMSMKPGTHSLYVKELHSEKAFKLTVEVDENAVRIYQPALEKLEPLDVPLASLLPAAAELDIVARQRDSTCLRVDAKRSWIGGNLQEAAESLAHCTRLYPDAWDCWRSLASVEAQRSRPAEACAAYRRYLDLRPRAPDAAFVTQTLARCPN